MIITDRYKAKYSLGFTLLEVLIAVSILATLAVLVAGSLDSAMQAEDANKRKVKEIERLDRMWIIMENDFRHLLAYEMQSYEGSKFPALKADDSDENRLIFLRGGNPNKLYFKRTELNRVGYRFTDNQLWRDSWVDPANPDEDNARNQLLVDKVDDVEMHFLPINAKDIEKSDWVDAWPVNGATTSQLPLAIKIIIRFENEIELERIFSLVVGV